MKQPRQLDMLNDSRAEFLHKQVTTILSGGATKRFHTHATIAQNTVAAHSWGVACWVMVLTGNTCGAPLLMAALTHDMAEFYTGDIPAPTKRYLQIRHHVGKMEEGILTPAGMNFEHLLTEDDKRTLKLADAFDGMMFCIQELNMGNKNLNSIYMTFSNYYLELNPQGIEKSLHAIAESLYKEARR